VGPTGNGWPLPFCVFAHPAGRSTNAGSSNNHFRACVTFFPALMSLRFRSMLNHYLGLPAVKQMHITRKSESVAQTRQGAYGLHRAGQLTN
jgi:hypothetical protein